MNHLHLHSKRIDFAQDHWALWTGLIAFLAIQLFLAKCLAISSICFFLIIGLSIWLGPKLLHFDNPRFAIISMFIPLVSCLYLWTFGSNHLEPGRKNAIFTLSDLRSSAKGRVWLSGLLQIQAPDGNGPKSCLRISLGIERKNVELSMGRWQIKGKLVKKPFSSVWQFICPDEKWVIAPTHFSKLSARWALWRFEAKTKILAHLTTALPSTRARAFIIGLLTGQQPDQRLGYLLSRVGLAHLMAVSGFHFACVLAAGTLLLRLLGLHHPFYALFPLALYFAYMGPTASVFRAAVMSIFRILSICYKKTYRPLQGLGIALILWCLLWPECSNDLGFLLSYLCTGALLLLSRPMEKLLVALWPILRKTSRSGFDRYWPLIRMTLSANLSAHIATIAPQLYFWHFFPLASLIYNLLFPPIISLIMPLAMLAVGLSFITSLLGHALLRIVHALLLPLLRSTDIPRPWESLIWAECNLLTVSLVTALLAIWGLIWHERNYKLADYEFEKWIS